eukprot:SAG11_NODE_3554_length_2375_cov_3.807118_2_plen_52_part_00
MFCCAHPSRYFEAGAVETVARLRAVSGAGGPSGAIYLSGALAPADGAVSRR